MRPSAKTGAMIVVALALFTDGILYYAIVPLLPGYARELHLGQLEIGLLVGSYAASLLVATVPLGRLADRVGRRTPLLWGLVGLFATTLAFAWASSYPLLVAARVLQGLSATVTWTAGMALLADHFMAEARARAMAVVFALANLGTLLGPPLAGMLAERWGRQAPFYAIAGLALVDAAARLFLLREADAPRGAPLGILALLRDGTVRVFAGAMALAAGMLALLESTLPLHFDQSRHLSPATIGLLFGATAGAHMATAPLVTAFSHRVGRLRVLQVGLLAVAVLLPMPVLAPGLPAIFASLLGLGVVLTLVMSPASPALADAVERRGGAGYASVFGLLNLAYALGMMVCPAAGSAAVEAFGILPAFVAIGLVFAGYTLVVRKVDAAEAAPPPRDG
jgi:multidrug resistance protein